MSTEKMSRYMIALWACEGIARQLAQRATRLTGKEMRKFLAGVPRNERAGLADFARRIIRQERRAAR